METSPDRREYRVYVHYGLKRGIDWEWGNHGLMVKYDTVTPRLAGDLGYLRQVLAPRRSTDGQLWEGYAFKDTDALKNWFGYYITGVPGVFVARIPQGSYSGTVKHSHKWGLFHEDSGYPLTNMVFKTRKAAWACTSA